MDLTFLSRLLDTGIHHQVGAQCQVRVLGKLGTCVLDHVLDSG